jgi:rubredoxin
MNNINTIIDISHYSHMLTSVLWACSECAWVFNPSSSPTGKSLDEMKRNFELQRDKEFAAHVCNKHPRATN